MEIVNEYLINQRTIAIQPHLHPQYQTKIIDMEGIYYTSERPAEILARSCVKYGATKQSICRLKFHNYTEIEFPVSSQTIRQQIQKAAVIYSIFCTEQKISYSFITDGKKRPVR